MSWRKNLHTMSHRQLKELAALCGGVALLIGVAVFLSGAVKPLSIFTLNSIAPASQTASTLSCWLNNNCNNSSSMTAPTIYSFGAPNPNYGEPGTLSWNTSCTNESAQIFFWTIYATYTCTLSGGKFGGGVSVASQGSILTDPVYGASPQYSLNCTESVSMGGIINGSASSGAVTTVYSIIASPPAVTISADQTSIAVGKSAVITATFTPGSSDSLVKTAINGPAPAPVPSGYNWAPVPRLSVTPPQSKMTYTFIPDSAGQYTFIPDVWSTNYGSWNHSGGKSVVITVGAAPSTCVNGSGPAGACTACNNGFTLNNANGTCVSNPPSTCSGAHQVNPPTCSCDTLSGYTGPNGGPCVFATCPDPHAIAPLCFSCQGIYSMVGGTCTDVPSLTLTAAQSRVQKGSPASLSWSVTKLDAGGGVQCSISSFPSGVFSTTMPLNTSPTWRSGSKVATGAINSTTIFTLSCTNAAPVSVTVGLIPIVKEI